MRNFACVTSYEELAMSVFVRCIPYMLGCCKFSERLTVLTRTQKDFPTVSTCPEANIEHAAFL